MTQDNTRLKGAVRSGSDPKAFASIMANHEHSHLSDKYQFIPTTKIIDILAKQGWNPVMVQEKSVRKEDREGFQKHLIRFRQDSAQAIDGIFPEVLLTNSHDGSASFVFMAGLFRLICTNGLIVSNGMFGSIKVRHMNFQQQDVIEAVDRVVEDTPKLLEHVDIYQSIQLSRQEQYAFAESALNMKFKKEGSRFDNVKSIGETKAIYELEDRRFNMDTLLKPLRSADADSPSLWNTFNIIQEKFIKGGIFEDTVRPNANPLISPTHVSKVRGIKGIDESIRVNKELWGLTENMAQFKAA